MRAKTGNGKNLLEFCVQLLQGSVGTFVVIEMLVSILKKMLQYTITLCIITLHYLLPPLYNTVYYSVIML